MMLPDLKISAFCWSQVTTELDRVAPHEGIVVPLVALELREADFNPCSMMELDDIGTVLIGNIVIVPSHKQRNQMARVSVLQETDEIVGERIEALVKRYPRLRACAYLHSHPFSLARTWPSRGERCDYEGHMLPLLDSNREAGLNTSFSFIACRGLHHRWRLQGFALGRDRQIVDLGFVRVIPDDAPELDTVFLPSLWRRPLARGLMRHWRRQLRRYGTRCKSDELFDGWIRLVCRVDSDETVVCLVPIELPEQPPRFFLVQNGSTRELALDHGEAASPNAWSHAFERIKGVCNES